MENCLFPFARTGRLSSELVNYNFHGSHRPSPTEHWRTTMEADFGGEVEIGGEVLLEEVVLEEVGAEIELQEDHDYTEEACVVLENRHDCPSWNPLHSSDSSCDESVETRVVEPTIKLKDAEILKREEVMNPHLGALPEKRKLDVGQQVAKFSISQGLRKRLCTYGVVLGGKPDLWNNAYKAALQAMQKQGKSRRGRGRGRAGACSATAPQAAHDRRPRLQVNRPLDEQTMTVYKMEAQDKQLFSESSNFTDDQEYSCSERFTSSPGYISSQDEVEEHSEAYQDSRAPELDTRPADNVDHSLNGHMCSKCGKHFRRQCNLQKHVCLKVSSNNKKTKRGPRRQKKCAKMGPAMTTTNVGKQMPEANETRSNVKTSTKSTLVGKVSKYKYGNKSKASAKSVLDMSKENCIPDTVDLTTLEKMCLQAQNELRQLQNCLHAQDKPVPPLESGTNFNLPIQVGRRPQKLQNARNVTNAPPRKKKVLIVEVLAPDDSEDSTSSSGAVRASSFNRSRKSPAAANHITSKGKNVYRVISHLNGYVRPWSITQPTFVCDHCGRRFMRKCNLDKHVCWDMDPKFLGLKGVFRRVSTEPLPTKSVGAVPTSSPINPGDSLNKDTASAFDKCANSEEAPQPNVSSLNKPACPTVAQVRGPVKRKFKCQQCLKTFVRNCDFVTHLRWHEKEAELLKLKEHIRKLQETIRDAPEMNKQRLDLKAPQVANNVSESNANMSVSSDGSDRKPFSCDECGRQFVHKCNLARHIRMHIDTNFFKEDDDGESSDLSLGMPPLSDGELAGILNSDFGGSDIGKYQQKHYQEDMEEYDEEGEVEDEEDEEWSVAEERKKDGLLTEQEDDSTSNPACDFDVVVKTEEDFDFFEDNPHRHDRSREKDEGFMVVEVPGEDGQESKTVMMDIKGYDKIRTLQSNLSSNWSSSEEIDSFSTYTDGDYPVNRKRLAHCINPAYKLLCKSAANLALWLKTVRRYKCLDCGVDYGLPSQLKRHRNQRKRRTRLHRCDCRKVFRGRLHFLRHQLQHLDDTVFICATCGQSLMGHRQLLSHGWVHPNVSHFQCSCGVEFRRLPRYLWHTLASKRRCR